MSRLLEATDKQGDTSLLVGQIQQKCLQTCKKAPREHMRPAELDVPLALLLAKPGYTRRARRATRPGCLIKAEV